MAWCFVALLPLTNSPNGFYWISWMPSFESASFQPRLNWIAMWPCQICRCVWILENFICSTLDLYTIGWEKCAIVLVSINWNPYATQKSPLQSAKKNNNSLEKKKNARWKSDECSKNCDHSVKLAEIFRKVINSNQVFSKYFIRALFSLRLCFDRIRIFFSLLSIWSGAFYYSRFCLLVSIHRFVSRFVNWMVVVCVSAFWSRVNLIIQLSSSN